MAENKTPPFSPVFILLASMHRGAVSVRVGQMRGLINLALLPGSETAAPCAVRQVVY